MDSSDEETCSIPTNMFVDVDQSMFVGRHGLFDILENRLNSEKVVAISGMGGVGKTTFTCLYAYINMKKYKNGVLFVDARSLNMLSLNFAALAGSEVLNLVPNAEEDTKRSTKEVSTFLQRQGEYLLIYDSADDIEILEELGKQRPTGFRFIPPKVKLKGHIIITSRCPKEKFHLVQIQNPIILEDLSSEEAQLFLWRRVYGNDDHDQEEKENLKRLSDKYLRSYLPLYLEHTASYIRGANISFKEFMKEASQMQETPLGAASYGDNRYGIEERYVPTYDEIQKDSHEAAVLMNYTALCNRDIPMALFAMLPYTIQTKNEQDELDEDAKALVNYLLKSMEGEYLGTDESLNFSKVSEAGGIGVKKLLAYPRATQLVNYDRLGKTFTMHAIIQDQLCARMKEQGKMGPSLKALARVLFNILNSNDVSLSNKRTFLAHADRCADHMDIEGSVVMEAIFLRLRIKTAYIFASLDQTDVALSILDQVEKRLSKFELLDIRRELLSVKAKICIWQHRAKDALEIAHQGLDLFQYGNSLDMADLDATRQYAVLRKALAHALIMTYDADLEKIHEHIAEARRAFEYVIEKDRNSGSVEHATLLMLHGQMHRNLAYKHQDDPERNHQELTKASKYLHEAYSFMDKEASTTDLCRIHLLLVDVKLDKKSRSEAIQELGECHEALLRKLGHNHRFTAWVLEKTAQLMSENSDHEQALELFHQSLEILKEVYGQDGGKVQIGGTMLSEGKTKLALGLTAEALQAFVEAQTYLGHTPGHNAHKEVCSLIEETKNILELEGD